MSCFVLFVIKVRITKVSLKIYYIGRGIIIRRKTCKTGTYSCLFLLNKCWKVFGALLAFKLMGKERDKKEGEDRRRDSC